VAALAVAAAVVIVAVGSVVAGSQPARPETAL
jgi:hypothetical protein